MEIHNLKVNGIKEPLGYQFDYLSFSWELSAIETEEELIFTVEVSKDLDFKTVLWTESTSNSFNVLSTSGDFLEAQTRYYWRISTQNAKATSWFETAKMDQDWSADWISYEEDSVECVTFSKNIYLQKSVRSARLYALGLGLYEVEINGEKVGREYLTPGYHSYDLFQQYQTYDVTELLTDTTTLNIIVGNGWYRGRFVFEGGFKNIYGDKQKLIAELHVTFQDGTEVVLGTDASWKTSTTHIQDNSIYDGEIIDFRVEPIQLTTHVDFTTKSLLTARVDLPVEVVATFHPHVFRDAKGQLILDYGQEITGWISGILPAGKNATFQFGELLQGHVFYTENLRTAQQTFVLLNNQQERYVRPHFTFFGFRYVKVEGLTEEEARKFTAQALQSKMDETFRFVSSHEKLNRLVSNIRWSQKDNFLSIPTDCPQRDERMGWTGDITVFANTASYNMETRAFLGHFLKNLRLEQIQLEGAVPFFAPYPKISPQEGLNPFLTSSGVAVWGDAATFLPFTLYRHFRDLGLLATHIEGMIDWVNYIYQQDEARGGKRLWDFGMQLGDWLALDTGIPSQVLGATDSVLIASVYYYISVNRTKQALIVLKDCRVDFYQKLENEIRQAIIGTYFTGDDLNLAPSTLQSEVEQFRQEMMRTFAGHNLTTRIDTQTGLAILLRYGLYPSEKARQNLVNKLKNKMEENGGALTTGFAGTPELPHALLDNGLENEAFDLLFKETAPSWLFEVIMGATTTWERWDSLLPDGKISGVEMNSMNHYAYGAVEDFIVEKLLGINLPEISDETSTYHIKPHYTKYLDWVEGSLRTPNGNLTVRWEIDKDKVRTKIDIPVRTEVAFTFSNGKTLPLSTGQNIIEDRIN